MKLASVVSLAFLAGSFAAAQAPERSFGTASMENLAGPVGTASGAATLRQASRQASQGCPVSLHAQHGSGGNILKVDKSRPAGIAQLLHLVLTNPDSRQIVTGRFTVRGLSGKGRIAQARGSLDSSDTTRNLEARFFPESGREVAGNIWAPGMTAVLSVELNAVTFADGSTWRFTERDGCRVTPDPLMLIAGR